MNILEFDSLYLEFGMNRILSSIYMRCETGKIIGLLGRNGSGKSCLMKIVFGAMASDHKSVRFNGVPLMGNYFPDKIISYLPQEQLIPPFLTVGEAFKLFDVAINNFKSTFPELESCLKKRASELSGGQLRLMEVLLVLNSSHPFCILDEPFSGLSPLQIEKLVLALRVARQDKGIIITDHLHRDVRSISDELFVLSAGKTFRITDEEQLVELGYLVP